MSAAGGDGGGGRSAGERGDAAVDRVVGRGFGVADAVGVALTDVPGGDSVHPGGGAVGQQPGRMSHVGGYGADRLAAE